MRPELPELSEYQLVCLRKFLRFEFPIEILRKVLAPLVTFTVEGPGTLHAVKYAAGIPKNPVKLTRADIDFALETAIAFRIICRATTSVTFGAIHHQLAFPSNDISRSNT